LNLGADRYIQKGGDPRAQYGILAQAVVSEVSRKKAEEQLYESERKFRAIVEQSHDGITLTNEEGEIIEWNDAQAQITEIPFSKAIGLKLWEIQFQSLPSENRTEGMLEQLKSSTLKCLETGDAPWLNTLVDYPIEGPHGKKRFMQQLPFSIKTQRGHMLCSITRDITELKETEFILKKSKTITDNLEEALILLDMDGLASFVNPTYEKITGYKSSEIFGKSGVEIVKKTVIQHDVDKILEDFGKAVKGEELPPISTYLKHKNGKKTPINFSVSFVRDDKGNAIQIVAVIRDITERKQAEEKQRTFIDAAIDPFLLFDSDLNVIAINEVALKGLGLNRVDAMGMSLLDISPDLKETGRYDKYMEVMMTGKPLLIKDLVPSPIFGEMHVEVKAFKVGDGLGVITRDITEEKRVEDALRESEEKFRFLSEQNIFGIVILQDGLIKYINNACAEIIGYSTKEMLDWTSNEFVKAVHPEDRPFVIEQARKKQLGESDTIAHYSFRLTTKTGNVKWIDNYSKTIMFEGKTADFSTLVDITERIKAEEALRESEENFRTFFNTIDDYLFNDSMTSRLGYKEEELLGKSVLIIHPKEEHENAVSAIADLVDGKTDAYPIPIITKDKRLILVETRVVNGKWSGKNVLFGISKDISELRESEEKYRMLVEKMQEGVLLEDAEGIISFVNPRTAEMLGYSEDELIGKHWSFVVSPKERDRVQAETNNRSKGIVSTYESSGNAKDGRHIPVIVTAAPIFSDTGEFKGVLSVITYIAKLKKAEEREELLFTLLGHDLINKIHVIGGYLQLLQDSELSEDSYKMIEKAMNANSESLQLLQKIEMLREIDQEGETSIVNLDSLLRGVIEKIKNLTAERKIEINYEEISFNVLGGPLLEELFYNLVENSIKHAHCSKIKISGYQEDEKIIVIVEDNGKGIPEKVRKRLFDKRNKGKVSTGLGLGTYLIKR
ncbi:MAG: PAS domain S-box protein, partial [Candidatus Hodarchaeales archaeon]